MTPSTRLLSRCAVIALFVACGMATFAAQAGADLKTFVGRVTRGTVITIVDGDTVHVRLDGGREVAVRLEGIDAPEAREAFSGQARNATRVLLFDKRVQLRGTDVDRYGRLVARVTVDDTDASLALVGAGLACHFTRYSSDHALAAAQTDARARGRGFWAPGAQAPACVAATTVPAPRAAASGPFRGNTESHVYHAASCTNYRCRRCTAVFQSAQEAERAGFRPAADCLR